MGVLATWRRLSKVPTARPILSAPACALRREGDSCRRRGVLAQPTTAAAKRGWSEAGRALGAPGQRVESIIWRGRERPAPGPARAHGHERRAPRSPPLGERQAESGRVGPLAVPGDQEALEP